MRAIRELNIPGLRLPRRHGKKTGLLMVLGLIGAGLIGGGAYAALGGSVRPQASGDVELQRGLIGHWKLDGNARDATPYARNGTVTGTTNVADRKGKTAAAKSFNGSSDTIAVSSFDSNVLTNGSYSSSWTLSVWAKASGTNVSERILVGKVGCNGGIETNGPTSYQFALFNAACNGGANVTYTPADVTQWHLLTATYSNGVMNFYGDGQLAGTNTAASIFTHGTTLDIGSGNTGNYYFNGSLDDVRVYNRALNAAEAKALYESYDPGVQAGSGEKGLVGHWKLDGNTKDSSPYAHNAVNTNAATLTSDRKGSANRAYSFNGTSNYMTVADSDALSPSTITVSAWVYWTGGTQPNIVSKHGNNAYRYRVNANGSITVFDRGATNALTTAASAITQNQWYMVSFSGDASGLKIYVNGQLSTSNATAFGSPNTAGPLWFGTFDTGSEYMSGTLDDIRIYNRALGASELLAIYQSYDSQLNLNAAPANNTTAGNINQGLLGYWPFSGNARDATPYSGNGTLVNSPTLATDRFGRTNSAYGFTAASSQEITMADSAALSPTTAMSVSAWFKGTVQDTSYASGGSIAGILTKDIGGGSATNPIYGFQVSNGTLVFSTTSSTNSNVQSTTSGLLDNTWYHAVGAYDGTNIRLYLNGVLADTDPQVTLEDSTGLLRIGRQKSGFVRFFEGTIDEVRVYNRALSLSEVQTLYAAKN